MSKLLQIILLLFIRLSIQGVAKIPPRKEKKKKKKEKYALKNVFLKISHSAIEIHFLLLDIKLYLLTFITTSFLDGKVIDDILPERILHLFLLKFCKFFV